MPIVADLEDLAAAEFLMMLALNRKTGKLTGVRGEDKVMVAVRSGLIVYAGSSSVSERIGSLLVGRGLVSEGELREAIRRQEAAPGVAHLGNILVEMGAITHDALARVVRGQFQRVVGELLSWEEGVLTFNRIPIPDLGAIHVSPREILVDMGFATEELVLGGMTELEDASLAASAVEAAGAASPGLEAGDDEGALVRSMMAEMQRLSFAITAEVSLEVLQCAAVMLRRAVLVVVSPSALSGAGGFGVGHEGEAPEEVVRRFSVPRDRDTILNRVVASGEAYVGPMPEGPGSRLMLEQLGGGVPLEVVVVPLVVDGRVVAVLYGDNLPERCPIGPTDELVARLRDVERFVGARRG